MAATTGDFLATPTQVLRQSVYNVAVLGLVYSQDIRFVGNHGKNYLLAAAADVLAGKLRLI